MAAVVAWGGFVWDPVVDPDLAGYVIYESWYSDPVEGPVWEEVDRVPCYEVLHPTTGEHLLYTCRTVWAAPAYVDGVLQADHPVSMVCVRAYDRGGMESESCSNEVEHEGGLLRCIEGWPGVEVECE